MLGVALSHLPLGDTLFSLNNTEANNYQAFCLPSLEDLIYPNKHGEAVLFKFEMTYNLLLTNALGPGERPFIRRSESQAAYQKGLLSHCFPLQTARGEEI